MAVTGTPQCGSFVNVQEVVTGTNSAGTVTDNVTLGNQATGTTFSPSAGSATSLAVKWSEKNTASGAVVSRDLTTLTDALGAKTFAKVRVIRIQNLAAVDSGFNLTVKPNATNPWPPWLTGTTPAIVIPPQGEFFLACPNTAGWAVDATHKSIQLDPGANNVQYTFFLGGE
jgi:hypothetical protein